MYRGERSPAEVPLCRFIDPKAACLLSAQNKPGNEAHPYVSLPPSCSRSESGDGRLKAAATAITVFVSVQWPKLGRELTVCFCARIDE